MMWQVVSFMDTLEQAGVEMDPEELDQMQALGIELLLET
jgi:hypothetical protein